MSRLRKTVWKAWLRLALGFAQVFGASGLIATYLEGMRDWKLLFWIILAIVPLILSRLIFYRRIWWGFDEKN
jgi:hypothetical protein